MHIKRFFGYINVLPVETEKNDVTPSKPAVFL